MSLSLSRLVSRSCCIPERVGETSLAHFSDKEVRNLTATVHGIIASIPTEFPLSNRNGCSNSGLTCPLAAGQEYTYTQTVPVLSSYPNVSDGFVSSLKTLVSQGFLLVATADPLGFGLRPTNDGRRQKVPP